LIKGEHNEKGDEKKKLADELKDNQQKLNEMIA
jgi:hypothetical protein